MGTGVYMDDKDLIRQMKNGDRTSFDRIYEKYHVPIFRSAYLICGNREDAEDVLQDTFVTCWLCIGQLRNEECFRYWLFRIMFTVTGTNGHNAHMAIATGDRRQATPPISGKYY